LALIQTLDPHPGRRYTTARTEYLVPELLALREGSGWKIMLNPAVTPRLRVNPAYTACLARRRQPETADLSQQVQAARTLISHLGNRRETLLRVGEALARRQDAFLDSGPM